MSRVLSSATSLYTIVLAGATYNALRRPGKEVDQKNLMLRLNYKVQALRKMSQEIEELGPQVPNETLYTMLTLAAYGAAETLQPPSEPQNQSPLALAHDLDFYSRLPCEWAHLRALGHLLKQRGGLPAISRPGFAVAVSVYVTQAPPIPLLTSAATTASHLSSVLSDPFSHFSNPPSKL